MSPESLFDFRRQQLLGQNAPLADRMRPRSLDDFCGQERIVGPGRLLRRAIQADQLSSLIFYGPPGSGKTTLARIIANTTKADFITLNAVLSGVKEIRAAIEQAQTRLGGYNRRTILFIDEVHRFNKVQQDALLPHVENGTVTFIGATTENPYFEVNKALLSRSRIFALTTLSREALTQVAQQALTDPERGYGKLKIRLLAEAMAHLVEMANGDARALLNALELAVQTTPPDAEGWIVIDQEVAEESIQKKAVLYDKDGDIHYDVISAFIKSIRGSDPDAALYWLAKMVYAGEDPRFIFRRLLILASEDIGMADPQALQVVASAAQTYDYVGLPEGRFALAQACVYLATAPKSNSLFAFFSALASVEQESQGEVPDHLKDASRDGEHLGHGANYLYPHAFRDHWVAQQYLPAALQGRTFYQPGEIGYEQGIKTQVDRRREEQLALFLETRLMHDFPRGESNPARESGRAHGQWLKRTLENTGKRLGELRDTLYRLASCQADSLLLLLNDPSGLLLWEGVRRCPRGGVYSLIGDREAAKILAEQAQHLEAMSRPQILAGELARLESLHAEEPGVRFDIILARGLKGDLDRDPHYLGRLAELLAPEGRLVVAEGLPRFTQRLYALLPAAALPPELLAALREAEEKIYREPSLAWCEEEAFNQLFTDPAFPSSRFWREKSVSEIYLTRQDLDSWFTPRPAGEKEAYCQHLAKTLGASEIDRVRQAFSHYLSHKVVRWTTVTAYSLQRRAAEI